MKFESRFIAMSALGRTLCACSTAPLPASGLIQQTLLTRCPETLPPLTDGTGGEITLTMNDWAWQYHDCATRHNGLVDALNRADAIDEKTDRPTPISD